MSLKFFPVWEILFYLKILIKNESCIGLFGEIYFMEGELICMSDCNTLCVLINLTDHYDRWFEQVVEGGSADAGR